MSREQAPDFRPIHDRKELLSYFAEGEKSSSERFVGTETEKFVLRRSTGQMLSFEEPGGFGDLFRALVERFDWEPTPPDEGQVVALVGPAGAVTLEPGGQLELSGALCKTVFETAAEYDGHLSELAEIADPDLVFTSWGMNPGVNPDEVPWMPKSRYKIMREYLPKKGDLAHWMMKTTCTIQANYDYCSEEDATDLIHTALLASPIVGALFANSPIRDGEKTKFQSFRNHIWTRTDPDRCGAPDFMYRTDWGYADYIDYVFDVPMFFIRREDRYINMAGHSFAEFVARGYEGHEATVGDFELHLSTLFPDVRMKKYVEMRTADGGSRDAVLALPAIWKGLLYDQEARQRTKDLFHPLDEKGHRELMIISSMEGIHGQSTAYGTMAALGKELLLISAAGLDRIAAEAGHATEAIFLEPLQELLEKKRSFADDLASSFTELDGDLVALAERYSLW